MIQCPAVSCRVVGQESKMSIQQEVVAEITLNSRIDAKEDDIKEREAQLVQPKATMNHIL